MKKIGILTFQHVENYGALLQAYALKRAFEDQGHNVKILNYRCPAVENTYKIVKWPKKSLEDIIRQTAFLLLSPYKLYIRSRFIPFRKKYLLDTDPIFPADIERKTADFDVLVTGSDQVFNPRIIGFDKNYFLAFNKNTAKNYSYAASFGIELENLTDKERAFISAQLPCLHRLSVRERQGAQLVQALTGRTAEVHLDPTFLLNPEQWRTLAVTPKYTNYVLMYLMRKDPQLIAFAQKLAREKQCKLLYISPSADIRNRVCAEHITPTPQEWLGLFLNARYVVTNSFHGLAFSVNFNKEFFLGKQPPSWPVNSRLDNLLDITGLQERLYTHFTDRYDVPVDWTAVNEKIENERQKAFRYLQEITQ